MTLLGINSARRICNSPLFSETVILERASTGDYSDDGVWTPGAPIPVTVLRASVQPATGRQRETLPEAYRLSDAMMFFIATTDWDLAKPLRLGLFASDPDTLVYKGVNWKIYSVPEDFSSHGHMGVLAVRAEGQNG